jgi:hypothetical protein
MEGNLSPLSASLSQRRDLLAMPEKCCVSSLRPTERYAQNIFADVETAPTSAARHLRALWCLRVRK